MRIYDGAEQEWAVFSALCPPELMAIIKDPDMVPVTYEAVARMFEMLGFQELEMEFANNKKLRLPPGEDINPIIDLMDYQNIFLYIRPLLHLFVENIQSDSLRDLFEKKLDYYY